MARPAKFTDDEILDAALRQVTDGAGATVAGIAAAVGAPTGSIYHRFPSRDVLLARLWLRTVAGFQDGLVAVLADQDPAEAGRRTRSATSWSGLATTRSRPSCSCSTAATTCSPTAGPTRCATAPPRSPSSSTTPCATTRAAGSDRSRRSAQRRAAFAVVDIPFAAVRRHLAAGEAPPPMLDDLVVRAHDAVLEGS